MLRQAKVTTTHKDSGLLHQPVTHSVAWLKAVTKRQATSSVTNDQTATVTAVEQPAASQAAWPASRAGEDNRRANCHSGRLNSTAEKAVVDHRASDEPRGVFRTPAKAG